MFEGSANLLQHGHRSDNHWISAGNVVGVDPTRLQDACPKDLDVDIIQRGSYLNSCIKHVVRRCSAHGRFWIDVIGASLPSLSLPTYGKSGAYQVHSDVNRCHWAEVWLILSQSKAL